MKNLKALSLISILSTAVFASSAIAAPLSCEGGTIEKIHFSRTSSAPANAVRLALGEASRLGGTPCTDERSYVSEILELSADVIRSDKNPIKTRYSASATATLCCKAPTAAVTESLSRLCPDGILPQLKSSCFSGSYGLGLEDKCEGGEDDEEDDGVLLEANRQYKYCVPLPVRPDVLGANPTIRANAISYWDSPCANVQLNLRAPNGNRVSSTSDQPSMELVPYRPGLWVLEIKASGTFVGEATSDSCRQYQVYMDLWRTSPGLYLDGSRDPAQRDWCLVWPNNPVCR